jgi:O-acetylserine/cysteine efflux transporter
MKSDHTGDFFALTCAVVCGLGNIPAKIALDKINPDNFNFFLFLFAWIFSSLPLLRKNERAEILRTDPKTLGLILILAIIFAVATSLSMTALKMMEPATVSFLSRFEVILTIALAYMILKEKLLPIEILGGIIALGGIFILKYKTNVVIAYGATLMVMSALFYAISEIIIKKNIISLGPARFLFYRNLFMIPIFFAILTIKREKIYLPSFDVILLTMISALLLPVLGRATYQLALQKINISRAALITQSTPLFTAAFALAILHTYPTPIEWLGGILIIGGVIIVRLAQSRLSQKMA